MRIVNYPLRIIGIVHTHLSDEEMKIAENARGVVEIFEEFEEGLRGIDGFSHVFLISLLDRVNDERRDTLVVRMRRLQRFGISPEEIPEVGVFSCDSPHRPNPIGLSIVRLLERRGRFLEVEGLDLFDGTPILDIKPYTPARRIDDLRVPEWHERLWRKLGREP